MQAYAQGCKPGEPQKYTPQTRYTTRIRRSPTQSVHRTSQSSVVHTSAFLIIWLILFSASVFLPVLSWFVSLQCRWLQHLNCGAVRFVSLFQFDIGLSRLWVKVEQTRKITSNPVRASLQGVIDKTQAVVDCLRWIVFFCELCYCLFLRERTRDPPFRWRRFLRDCFFFARQSELSSVFSPFNKDVAYPFQSYFLNCRLGQFYWSLSIGTVPSVILVCYW